MTRAEFTVNIVSLLREMILLGEYPMIEYSHGNHIDIIFHSAEPRSFNPELGWVFWHHKWEQLGGKSMRDGYLSHFEADLS